MECRINLKPLTILLSSTKCAKPLMILNVFTIPSFSTLNFMRFTSEWDWKMIQKRKTNTSKCNKHLYWRLSTGYLYCSAQFVKYLLITYKFSICLYAIRETHIKTIKSFCVYIRTNTIHTDHNKIIYKAVCNFLDPYKNNFVRPKVNVPSV